MKKDAVAIGENVKTIRNNLGMSAINFSTNVFFPAVNRAGIKDLHFHDLRHTFASRLVESGVSLYVVQQLLGHSNPSMTQRYAHLSDSALRSAVFKLS